MCWSRCCFCSMRICEAKVCLPICHYSFLNRIQLICCPIPSSSRELHYTCCSASCPHFNWLSHYINMTLTLIYKPAMAGTQVHNKPICPLAIYINRMQHPSYWLSYFIGCVLTSIGSCKFHKRPYSNNTPGLNLCWRRTWIQLLS